MSLAYFDKNGICKAIAEHPLENDLLCIEVPEHTKPEQIYWNGKTYKNSRLSELKIPPRLNVGEDFSLKLPDHTMAMVSGVEQVGTLRINTGEVGRHRVVIMGAFVGDYLVSVESYVEQRAAEYPPIKDQLDALWKGGDEMAAMRDKVLAVKQKYPKEK